MRSYRSSDALQMRETATAAEAEEAQAESGAGRVAAMTTRATDTDNRDKDAMLAYLEARVEALSAAVKAEREENERLNRVVFSLIADQFDMAGVK